jgi:hypothetical protein
VDALLPAPVPEVGAVSRTSTVITIVFGLGFVFATAVGGGHVTAGRWGHAAAAYAIAALCILGAIREAGRATLPGKYTDDIEDEPETAMVGEAYTPAQIRPGHLSRLRAARTARREMRSMRCGCNRYWTSTGREHDTWCPFYERSST